MAGMQMVRGVQVSQSTVELVQNMSKTGKGAPSPTDITRAIVGQENFAGFYTEVAALHGEYPKEVDALSRHILGIDNPGFRATNLVETHFDGAIRGPGNAQGIISKESIYGQQGKMLEAMRGFQKFAADKKISWPTSPFEDSTNIPGLVDSDLTDVLTHGRDIYARFKGNVMALGVGGSSNGPRVITGAFQLEQAQHGGFTFASDHIRNTVVKFIRGKRISDIGHIFVTSLSGTTSETLSNLLIALEELKKAGVPENQYKNFITVETGEESSVLRSIADVYGLKIFYCKPNEGGRFSIWTVIGTLWAEANGIDSSEAKAGAMLAQYRILMENIRQNPSMMQAAIASEAWKQGISLYQYLLFDERLANLGDFLGQAWGESVEEMGFGLRVRVDVCANWQHIAANGLLGVPEGVMAQMFWVKHSNNPIILPIPDELKNIKLGNGTLGDLEGKNMDDYQEVAVKGGWASFVGRGIPTTLTTVDRITPFSVGQLTQETFGMVGFYGGSNRLELETYLQKWVVMHKALGRGETESISNMPNGQECGDAMHYFQQKFGS